MPVKRNEFGRMLKIWRKRLGLSQQALSQLTGVSTKHLSYLETAKSQPSAAMVQKLAAHLKLSGEDSANLFHFAGLDFSVTSRPVESTTAELLKTLLQGQEPNPAFVSNHYLDLQRMNNSAASLLEFFGIDITQFSNGLPLFFAANGLRQYMVNWQETAAIAFRLFRARETGISGSTPIQQQLMQLLREPEMLEIWQACEHHYGSSAPVLPFHLCKDGIHSHWQLIIATLGTPRHLALAEYDYQLNFIYPSDEATNIWLKNIQNK